MSKCILFDADGVLTLPEEVFSVVYARSHALDPQPFEDFNKDRHFYLYEGNVANLDFDVCEGDGAEAFTLPELHKRNDLTASAKSTLENIIKANHFN